MNKKSELEDASDKLDKAFKVYGVVFVSVFAVYVCYFLYDITKVKIFIWMAALSCLIAIISTVMMFIYPYWDNIKQWWNKKVSN